MGIETLIFIAFVVLIGSIFWYNKTRGDKKVAEQKALSEANWLASYQNPLGPNYDPVRIAAEVAAAWEVDPTNPSSPNYDPNYDPDA